MVGVADHSGGVVKPGVDPYAQALADLDELLVLRSDQHQIAWVTTARHLDRVIRAGERLRRLCCELARTPAEVELLERVVNNWTHAVGNGGDP